MIINASNLVKRYKDPDDKSKSFNAVDGISLSIGAGEIYGILGPNGAGKTTTLEMLEGLKDIDEGSAFINTIDVKQDPYKVKVIIGVQLQANEFFDNMNLVELLSLFTALTILFIGPHIKFNFSSLIIFSGSLALSDYLRSKLFTGFPWNLWAYSTSWANEILQIINIIGLHSYNLF